MINTEPVETDLIIGGEWAEASGGRTVEVHNPADPRQVVGYAASANREDTSRAISAAEAAFPGWSALSFRERAEYLLELAENLQENAPRSWCAKMARSSERPC